MVCLISDRRYCPRISLTSHPTNESIGSADYRDSTSYHSNHPYPCFSMAEDTFVAFWLSNLRASDTVSMSCLNCLGLFLMCNLQYNLTTYIPLSHRFPLRILVSSHSFQSNGLYIMRLGKARIKHDRVFHLMQTRNRPPGLRTSSGNNGHGPQCFFFLSWGLSTSN